MFNRSYILPHQGHPHYVNDRTILALQKRIASYRDDEAMILMRTLSDPTRFAIYRLLQRVEELAVSDIAFVLDMPQPAISHALRQLKAAGLITAHRCGKLICYSLV